MAEEESESVHTACEDGNLWSLQNYVKKNPGFDINAPDHTGRTCLMLAAENGHDKIADFLIHSCHANITKQDQFNQRSAIHLACRKGHVNVLRLLMAALSPERREEAANQPDKNGLTPLSLAQTRGGNPECMKELITDGARYNSVKVTVKTATNVMVAAMRFKKKTGAASGGFAALAAAKSGDASSSSQEPVAADKEDVVAPAVAAAAAAEAKATEMANAGVAAPEPAPAA